VRENVRDHFCKSRKIPAATSVAHRTQHRRVCFDAFASSLSCSLSLSRKQRWQNLNGEKMHSVLCFCESRASIKAGGFFN